jgi:YHS domain-containing protein
MKSRFAAVLLCVVFITSLATAAEKAKDTKKPVPINKVCPVAGGKVDPAATMEHDGKTIGFCCAGCDEDFKKDPPKYMAIIAKELKDEAAKEKDKGKKKEEGKEKKLNTKCPVTGDDADKAITTTYKGRTVAFCCKGCIEDFEKDPKKYLAKLDEAEKAEKKKEQDKEKKDGK